jgi:acylpyruvate hydrolase
MRLATLRLSGRTAAVRVEGDEGIDLGVDNVGAVLARPNWRTWAEAMTGERLPLPGDNNPAGAYAPVIPAPGKIICVGLNYAHHIREMGRDLPDYPTLFAKFPEALIGAHDDVALPPEAADAVDWEAELAVVVGSPLRRAGVDEAAAAIAGYAILNDVTMRDWQYRTPQWLQGKTFEATTPFGPVMVTPDELDADAGLELSCEVDGETVQQSNTADLVFDPARLLSYISGILTLNPGDVIATGTPGGVGHARDPKRYLAAGSILVTRIAGIGELRNTVVKDE